jgi:DNA-binding NtrC family response regulator
VPPLRDRGDDVLLLAHYFVERQAQADGRRPPTLDDDARAALCAYPWPGNVRELQNCLERAAILADGDVIRARHLHLREAAVPAAAPVAPAAPGLDLQGSLAEVVARAVEDAERRTIAAALTEAVNDPGRAAERLGLPFRDLLAKMRAYGLGTH